MTPKTTAVRLAGIATYVVFGIACLLLGFFGNTAYTERRLAEVADPDQYWGERAEFFSAPSFGGNIAEYVPEKSMTVVRDKVSYKFNITDTTRFIMKPDVTEVAPGTEVQVKYHQQPATQDHPAQRTALTVRVLSRSFFKGEDAEMPEQPVK